MTVFQSIGSDNMTRNKRRDKQTQIISTLFNDEKSQQAGFRSRPRSHSAASHAGSRTRTSTQLRRSQPNSSPTTSRKSTSWCHALRISQRTRQTRSAHISQAPTRQSTISQRQNASSSSRASRLSAPLSRLRSMP